MQNRFLSKIYIVFTTINDKNLDVKGKLPRALFAWRQKKRYYDKTFFKKNYSTEAQSLENMGATLTYHLHIKGMIHMMKNVRRQFLLV